MRKRGGESQRAAERRNEAKDALKGIADAMNSPITRSEIAARIVDICAGLSPLVWKRVIKGVERLAECGQCGAVYLLTRRGRLYCSKKCQKRKSRGLVRSTWALWLIAR